MLINRLFWGEDEIKTWNLRNLGDVLSFLPDQCPGVNTPMLYIGNKQTKHDHKALENIALGYICVFIFINIKSKPEIHNKSLASRVYRDIMFSY
jgi:hypothetical protein